MEGEEVYIPPSVGSSHFSPPLSNYGRKNRILLKKKKAVFNLELTGQ